MMMMMIDDVEYDDNDVSGVEDDYDDDNDWYWQRMTMISLVSTRMMTMILVLTIMTKMSLVLKMMKTMTLVLTMTTETCVGYDEKDDGGNKIWLKIDYFEGSIITFWFVTWKCWSNVVLAEDKWHQRQLYFF